MKNKSIMAFIMLFILAFFLLSLDTTISRSQHDEGQCELIGKVIDCDNDNLTISGVVMLGGQKLTVQIIRGNYKGEVISVNNTMMGQYEYDQYYEIGDKLLLGGKIENNTIVDAVALDYLRQNYIIILFGIFALFLLLYAGKVGARALISFVISILVVWFLLIPALLKGFPPVPLTLLTLIILSGVIIFSVAGFSKKAISAFWGSISGMLVPILLAYIFGKLMKIEGLTQSFAVTILLRGYTHLNLQDILYCSILLGASGACMDIAMDVAASMEEIKIKKPDINRKELIESGFNIGSAVIGTMSTTLLLAYSGSFLTLMMIFNINETSLVRLLNLKIFATEVMRILIGSLALLLVAPFTAFVSGHVLTRDKNKSDISTN